MPPRTALRAGDRVAVTWGVDTREGEVSAIYHTGGVQQVLVRLDASESSNDEPQTVVLPADAVRLLSDEPDLPAPGAWLRGFRYERAVAEALSRLLADVQPKVHLNAEISGRDVDILVESQHGVMIVDVKTVDRLSERMFDGAIRQLRTVMDAFPNAKGLFVTPSALPASVIKRTRRSGLLSSNVGVVRWRGAEDDKHLDRVAHALLNDNPENLQAAEA